MPLSWSNEEKTLLELVRAIFSTREIQQLFKMLGHDRTIDAIQKQSRKLGIVFKDYGIPATHELSKKEKEAVNEVLTTRKNFIEKLEPPVFEPPSIKSNLTSGRKTALNSLTEELNKIRKETTRTSSLSVKKSTNLDKETLVLVMSDWHFGQVIKDPEDGTELYNINIANDRVERTLPLIVSAVGMEKISQFDECVVLLIGDMVTGEGIFPHQEMSIEDHAVAQTLATTKALWGLLQNLRSLFPLVRVVTTKGNHGRTAHSPEANWDNVVYQQLELLIDLQNDPNLIIKNRYSDYATLEVKGWKGLIRHHAPVQAESAMGVAKFAGWYGIHDWNWFAFGHYHHWGATTWMGKPILRNGALSGGDEYAEGLARFDNPVQIVFGISESNPCTFVSPLIY